MRGVLARQFYIDGLQHVFRQFAIATTTHGPGKTRRVQRDKRVVDLWFIHYFD